MSVLLLLFAYLYLKIFLLPKSTHQQLLCWWYNDGSSGHLQVWFIACYDM